MRFLRNPDLLLAALFLLAGCATHASVSKADGKGRERRLVLKRYY
ncbi:MAG: hypothetical protein V3U11_08375 [Planctomycetota bacterium]